MPGVARRLRTFLARPRKVRKRRPPRCLASSIEEVTLRCLSWQGGCGTRPGRAHTTCPAMGLEQSSPTPPCHAELLGEIHGEKKQRQRRFPALNPSAQSARPAFQNSHMTRRAARPGNGVSARTVRVPWEGKGKTLLCCPTDQLSSRSTSVDPTVFQFRSICSASRRVPRYHALFGTVQDESDSSRTPPALCPRDRA